jgi:hypothetical protein
LKKRRKIRKTVGKFLTLNDCNAIVLVRRPALQDNDLHQNSQTRLFFVHRVDKATLLQLFDDGEIDGPFGCDIHFADRAGF